jgi:hypothetical protein
VHHDLVKRLLWTARDCRELGRPPLPGELLATLYDAEGQAVDAATLWAQLRDEAPAGVETAGIEIHASADVEIDPSADVDEDAPAGVGVEACGETAPYAVELDAFGTAVDRCVEAALRNDAAGVLCLELEFERLRAVLAPSLKEAADVRSTLGKDH